MKVKHFIKCVGNHTPLRIEYQNHSPLFDNDKGTQNIYSMPKWIQAKKIQEIRVNGISGFLILITELR